jgi:predicted cupin superfamily sugar epimerase
MSQLSAEDIIGILKLEPLDMEGGYFCQTYRSTEEIPVSALPDRYKRPKLFGTAIYYLLTPEVKSAMHRLPTDEIFHFYLGDPVTQLQLHPDGSSDVITLGSEIDKGQQPQVIVPRFTWQGSILIEGGRFALLGTTMAPGFDYDEYEAGDREELIRKYPNHRDLIIRLT